MTISLPQRPQIRGIRFDLIAPKALNPSRDGGFMGVLMGEPLWIAEIDTTELDGRGSGEWRWLAAQADARLDTVYLYDASRPRPLLGGPGGAPTITAVDRGNRTLRIEGLPANFVISAGDYVAWDDGPSRRLHVLGPAKADGSGVVTVRCEPPPPLNPNVSLPVAAIFEKPSAEFRIAEFEHRTERGLSSASLTAVQVMRRAAQTTGVVLTQTARFNNTNSFFSPTVTQP